MKLCVFCRHCKIDHMRAWGEYAEPATFECAKGHWRGITDYGEMENYRKQILVAETCPDYLPAKGIPT